MSLTPRRTVFAVAIFSAVPLLVACPKKDPPAIDAAPPPPPPVEDAAPLLPLEEDTGAPDADAAKPKLTGTPVNTNVARLKQCCNQLAVQAKAMGSSPEAGMFNQAAATCTTMATQAGPTGTAPELGALRALLVGRTIPAACAGF